MGTLALRVENGSKAYTAGHEHHPVFQDIDLSVESGEVFSLLGPSGCGKSTLLRILAGLDEFTSGHVEVYDSENRRHPIGIVFQDPLLLPWLTVSGNVGLGLRYGVNKASGAVESVDHILSDFGLAPLMRVYPGELSGGQAQRVSLARTLVTRPSILLLDEPFAALDPRTRTALQDWLLEIAHNRGLTVLIVTHDVEEATYLGNRVALMSSRPGSIIQIWDVHRGHERDRGSVRIQTIRHEILARYETDGNVATAPSFWQI